MDPEQLAALSRVVERSREQAHTYLGGVADADLYPMARGEGTLLCDDYTEGFLDFSYGGAMLATGHRDEKVYGAVQVQAHHHVYQGAYGEYLDWAVGRYAEALSKRFPPDADGNPRQVLFLNSSYEARLVASHIAASQGVGAALIDFLDPGGKPRDGGEIQDWVHQAKGRKSRVIADETHTGFGRTGTFCYAEQFGFVPDVTILGPAIGAGFPLVAVVAPKAMFSTEMLRTLWEVMGISGASDPVACAAGIAVLEQITDNMLEHVKEMGRVLHTDLDTVTDQFSHVIARHYGVGLLRTLHLREPLRAPNFRTYCRNAGLLITPALRMTPPLNCTEAQVRTAVDAVATAAISLGADMQQQEAPVP